VKHIVKRESPEAFERWKAQEPKPTKWTDLQGRVPVQHRVVGIHYYSKPELLTALHQEQLGICAYCNVGIPDNHTSPIDHVEPREGDTRAERIFDYGNVVASCSGGQRSKIKPRKLHCDPGKRDDSIPISPLNPNCETEIKYAISGEIITKGQPAAVVETVKVLNLNLEKIVLGRKALIDAYIWADVEQVTLILPEEAGRLLANFSAIEKLSPGQDRSYASAVKSVLQKLTV
jgi:uncharacterized protein (TIGR02646 family)